MRYKTSADTESSKTISKLDILKMSNEEIRAVDFEIAVKAGVFYPINAGGAGLGPSAIYLVNFGFSSMIERNWRFSLEAGYTQSKSKDASERYIQVIPITLNSEYRFVIHEYRNISAYRHWSSACRLQQRRKCETQQQDILQGLPE